MEEDVVRRLSFGQDNAEVDLVGDLLEFGFVETAEFSDALTGPRNLIIGRKGSGKSAIRVRLAAPGVREGATAVITPDAAAGGEIRRFELQGLTNESAKAVVWRYVFAVHVARHVVEHAKHAHGKRSRRKVRTLRRFLEANGEAVGEGKLYERVAAGVRGLQSSLSLEAFGFKASAQLNGHSEGVRASKQIDALEGGIAAALLALGCAHAHEPLLLLVDQLEKVWSADEDSAAMVVGLLLASKAVTEKFGAAVRCVLFVRADIYDALDFSESDWFHSDEIRISWTVEDLKTLAVARASASLARPVSQQEMWEEILPAEVHGEAVIDYLMTRSLPRPRDLIQFLNACRNTAVLNKHTRIEPGDIIEAALGFSQWKLYDLAGEYRVAFPYLQRLLVIFQNSGYIVTRAAVAERLSHVRSELEGHYPRYVNVLGPDAVIETLYAVGFLGVSRGGGLVYAGGTALPIQPYENEFHIHPCFRSALNALQSIQMDPYRAVLHIAAHGVDQGISNVVLGKGRRYRAPRDFALVESLRASCQRVLRQLGRASLPAATREDVSVQLGRIIGATNELYYALEAGEQADGTTHVVHTLTYLRAVATRLAKDGLDADLVRRIEDEVRDLTKQLTGERDITI